MLLASAFYSKQGGVLLNVNFAVPLRILVASVVVAPRQSIGFGWFQSIPRRRVGLGMWESVLQDAFPVNVVTLSDTRDIGHCGDVSEEEPGFIPNSFVIEEVHRNCWSIFTNTQDAIVYPDCLLFRICCHRMTIVVFTVYLL